jgi:hypothetical protein
MVDEGDCRGAEGGIDPSEQQREDFLEEATSLLH